MEVLADVSPAPEPPREAEPSQKEASMLLHAETAEDVARRMACRHRDVVKILVSELATARERGANARERLSHALVLLDEAQAELIRVSGERDALAKAKIDLQADNMRLQGENHRLATDLQDVRSDLFAQRSLTDAALEETGRNRALLQHKIRGDQNASATPSAQKSSDPVPSPPLQPRTMSPPPTTPQQHPYGSPVHLPSRPPAATAIPADPDFSSGVSLSAEGHVAVASQQAYDGAHVVYTAALSMNGLDFVATVRSREQRLVEVGFASTPLDGDVAAAAYQCILRGDGVVRIRCDGSEIETRLTVSSGGQEVEHRGNSRQTSVHWDAMTRKVSFTLPNGVRATPLVLPPAFTSEALCPVVRLPAPGDDVLTRRK